MRSVSIMSFIWKKKGLLSVCTPQLYRCQGKVNIKHPRPVHKERRLMAAVAQPVYRKHVDGCVQECSVLQNQVSDSSLLDTSVDKKMMYETFLIKEVKKLFASSRMIVAFQPDALDARKRTQICNKLSSGEFSAIFYPLDILRRAVHNSKWQNFAVLLQGQTVIVVNKSLRMMDLLNICRKIPELVLLGGVVDDVLLTREGFHRYLRLPMIDELHCELVGLLNTTARTSEIMTLDQLRLVRNLERHCKYLEESTTQ